MEISFEKQPLGPDYEQQGPYPSKQGLPHGEQQPFYPGQGPNDIDLNSYPSGSGEPYIEQRPYQQEPVGTVPVSQPIRTESQRRSRHEKKINSSFMCLRYLLCIGNLLLLMFACVIIGLEIYLIVDKVTLVSTVFGISLIEPSCYLVMSAGCLAFIMAFIGCAGALFQSRKLLLGYIIGMALIAFMALVGFIMAIVFRSHVNDERRNYMRTVLENDYGVNLELSRNQEITDAWNRAQWKWYCCGVDAEGYGVYRSSQWYQQLPSATELLKPLVPESCCMRDQYDNYLSVLKCQTWPTGPPTMKSTVRNDALFYLGCFQEGQREINHISEHLIGIGVVLTIFAGCLSMLALFALFKSSSK